MAEFRWSGCFVKQRLPDFKVANKIFLLKLYSRLCNKALISWRLGEQSISCPSVRREAPGKLTSSAFGLGHQFPRASALTSGQQFNYLTKPWNKCILFTKATSMKCPMDCLYIHVVIFYFEPKLWRHNAWVLSASPGFFIMLYIPAC